MMLVDIDDRFHVAGNAKCIEKNAELGYIRRCYGIGLRMQEVRSGARMSINMRSS